MKRWCTWVGQAPEQGLHHWFWPPQQRLWAAWEAHGRRTAQNETWTNLLTGIDTESWLKCSLVKTKAKTLVD